MGRIDKLIQKLKSNPKDFTWNELTKLLSHFGYEEQKTGKSGGSRRKFVNAKKDIISLHKPHPANTIKTYVVKQIIEHLNL